MASPMLCVLLLSMALINVSKCQENGTTTNGTTTNETTTIETTTIETSANQASTIAIEAPTACFVLDSRSNQAWKLIFDEEFNSQAIFKNHWTVDDEDNSCDEWADGQSCNSAANVQLVNGYLVMSMRREPRRGLNFTGGMLTTNEKIASKGRVEMRALQPDGGPSVNTAFYSRRSFLKDGRLYIAQLNHIDVIYRDALLREHHSEKLDSESENVLNRRVSQGFHRYGVEWNEEKIEFFIDDTYSKPSPLNANRTFIFPQELRLWFGLRSDAKVRHNSANWKCPAFIVDYLRVYEPITLQEVANQHLVGCSFEPVANWTTETEQYKEICANAKHQSTVHAEKLIQASAPSNAWVYICIGLVGFIIAFLVGLAFLQEKRIGKLKDKKSEAHPESLRRKPSQDGTIPGSYNMVEYRESFDPNVCTEKYLEITS